MASLKDLRNRIASVKATQKITKAMQMVAAAKLRRAQIAAEAARPYAERMDRVLANLAAGMIDAPDAPRLLRGTGSDKKHLLIVAPAERGHGLTAVSMISTTPPGETRPVPTVARAGKSLPKNRRYSSFIAAKCERSVR